ncbi:hypothetical protein E7T06_19350 [Deinococcus sp. Arct2-2]|uniref:hypothetical protein n=1 Tax=Deinococcus sp. Arct2-2 TaxID=2568653 RepID=UPI0010A4330A|nr:hypothetical protein [Deinococcus sp. Arct2-2]THF67810.1 hypothetical protein E7T06_19350 [Deinococcus sp. Arct2-2]
MSRPSRRPRKLKPAPIIPPPASDPAPLPIDLLTGPRGFGTQLAKSEPIWWRYWAAVIIPAVLSGVAYALLVRPAANLAAELTKAASPPLIVHVTNAFGSVFLTVLTFAIMWGLGRLGAGRGQSLRGSRVPEIFSASFALLVPLYLLVIVLTLSTPAGAWVPAGPALAAAGQNPRLIQLAALASAAQTSGALALGIVTVLGTVAQCVLAFFALRQTVGNTGRAALGALLPLLPALLVGFIAIAPLLLAR